jgi:hypothetical protein
MATTPAPTCFKDDDRGFQDWRGSHPVGYFVNCDRKPRPAYLVLHTSGCSHFTGNPARHWTRSYIKICAPRRAALEQWATGTVGGDVTLCPTCMG